MATGIQSLYNYNNGTYSATGYPFANGKFKLQYSYSTSILSKNNLQSTVSVSINVANYGLDIGARQLKVYWNGTLQKTINTPAIKNKNNYPHTSILGETSFTVQHDNSGHCSGTLTVEWLCSPLTYSDVNITELGARGEVTPNDIPISGGGAYDHDYSLIINGQEMIPYIQDNGISVSRADRSSSTVTTLDGTDWKSSIEKHKFSVKIKNMSAEQYKTLISKYLLTNPGSVSYKNVDRDNTVSGTFYFFNIKYNIKRVVGNTTYLTNISFDMEER